jgi:nucleoside-diphosphate-sugar epimerase
MASLLVIGAGYLGAAVADQALARGDDVLMADNWYATRRAQLAGLEARGAQVVTADVRSSEDVAALLARRPDRVVLLAAQASRPASERDPDYTEQTNLTGVRRVGQAASDLPVVFASSLHVYGPDARGEVGPDHPYGRQGDLAHLSKVYGELCLQLLCPALTILRLGIVHGPSPVEHEDPDHVTVVDKFRRLAAEGRPLPLDDGGRATIGVVHVEDAARIVLDAPPGVHNVAAEALTVADVAAIAEGRAPTGVPQRTFPSPFAYRHRLAA